MWNRTHANGEISGLYLDKMADKPSFKDTGSLIGSLTMFLAAIFILFSYFIIYQKDVLNCHTPGNYFCKVGACAHTCEINLNGDIRFYITIGIFLVLFIGAIISFRKYAESLDELDEQLFV